MSFDGEALVAEFVTVWNAHDLDGILAMFTDDVVFEGSIGPDPWGTRAIGKAATRAVIEQMFGRIPDVRYEELRHFVSPEQATVESLTTGTPRNGARFEVHLVDVLTLRDGRIAAKRSYRKAML